MNADDRQVIRDALDHSANAFNARSAIFEGDGKRELAEMFAKDRDICKNALALLDKPQPESAGDAMDVAEQAIDFAGIYKMPDGELKVEFHPAKYAPIIEVFASSIRSEALEEAAKGTDLTDIRWAVNVLLEKIAQKFDGWGTYDIWRSDAAMVVRGFKHDLTKPTGTP